MSSSQSIESKNAMATNKNLAEGYYGMALPALRERFGAINKSLAEGESPYMKAAYAAQRAGLTEGITEKNRLALAQQARGSKAATAGGNAYAALHPSDMGAQLANALYGSKFTENQNQIDQSFNLMSMALGGAGTTGSAALDASGNQLRAIGYLPNYNPTYAGAVGALNAGMSIYGAYQGASPYGSSFSGAYSTPQGTLSSFSAE